MLTKTPTGRIPGTVMRFKIDSNFMRVVRANPAMYETRPVSELAAELCQTFIDSRMIEDTPDNYGVTVIQATGDKLVSDVCAGLSAFLFGECRAIHCDVFDAFCRLVILGDGDCPECGGKLKFIETEGHELKDGDYYTPNSYVVDKYVYQCRECGATIKTEKEL